MQARAGIREVHFFPFNPVDKRTALTYIDSSDNWHRVSKGAPEQVKLFVFVFLTGANFLYNDIFMFLTTPSLAQILNLCNSSEAIRKTVHGVIDRFAECGLRSLGVARQVIKC